MAEARIPQTEIEGRIHLVLTEGEARTLAQLFLYDIGGMARNHLSEAKFNRDVVNEVCRNIKGCIEPALNRIDMARKVLRGEVEMVVKP